MSNICYVIINGKNTHNDLEQFITFLSENVHRYYYIMLLCVIMIQVYQHQYNILSSFIKTNIFLLI